MYLYVSSVVVPPSRVSPFLGEEGHPWIPHRAPTGPPTGPHGATMEPRGAPIGSPLSPRVGHMGSHGPPWSPMGNPWSPIDPLLAPSCPLLAPLILQHTQPLLHRSSKSPSLKKGSADDAKRKQFGFRVGLLVKINKPPGCTFS